MHQASILGQASHLGEDHLPWKCKMLFPIGSDNFSVHGFEQKFNQTLFPSNSLQNFVWLETNARCSKETSGKSQRGWLKKNITALDNSFYKTLLRSNM